jgi:osmoprotectant transport system permease protein
MHTPRHRPWHPRHPWHLVLLFALALFGMAPRVQAASDTLRVGSKRFTESYILAELLAQTAAPHTASPPVVRQGLGNTAIVYEALRSGAIDLYAEYTGTIAQEISRASPPTRARP